MIICKHLSKTYVTISVIPMQVFSSSHDSKLRMYSMEEMHLTRSVALGRDHPYSIYYVITCRVGGRGPLYHKKAIFAYLLLVSNLNLDILNLGGQIFCLLSVSHLRLN